MSDYRIRDARRDDIEALVTFTIEEGREAEQRTLDREAVVRGVTEAFDDPAVARYWVAEATDGAIAGSISIVKEWSNFNGAYYWWVQSVFVAPGHRGRGVVEMLLDHVARSAADAGALDVRLYAHASNQRALRAYRRSGFAAAPYMIMRREIR